MSCCYNSRKFLIILTHVPQFLTCPGKQWSVWQISWEPNHIQLAVDKYIYFEYVNNGSGSSVWPFDQEFHLIMNVAVGGTWGGQQGIDTAAFECKLIGFASMANVR